MASGKPTVGYTLFKYRSELAMKKARPMRLYRTKIDLTEELISRTFKNVKECSMEDLNAMSREMLFKQKLLKHIRTAAKNAKKTVKDVKNKMEETE
ncbi:uncharacterized protein LOC119665310 [Teleopsis dalmanni]|uniref:uncharacterized protein LOC119665310 n=1 Tax=Teleopsis dalmanni TaxID=139649 RepID=UPI0018CF277D|nr:uncharacterized protein LOC119665310 [Teleopsis dalmanni]